MPNYQGQKIDTRYSGGLGVGEMWVFLFNRNEALWKSGQVSDILTDKELTERMFLTFPDRADARYWRKVPLIRGRYNRGDLPGQGGRPPIYPSVPYTKNLSTVFRVSPRGKILDQKPI